MAQKKLSEWAEDFENLLIKMEDWEFLNHKEQVLILFAAQAHVQRWLAEATKGEAGRAKVARWRANRNRLSTGADVPLWGDE